MAKSRIAAQYTVRQFLFVQQIKFLRGMYDEIRRYQAFDAINLTSSQADELARQTARRHNHVLEQSGLDGLPIDHPTQGS